MAPNFHCFTDTAPLPLSSLTFKQVAAINYYCIVKWFLNVWSNLRVQQKDKKIIYKQIIEVYDNEYKNLEIYNS